MGKDGIIVSRIEERGGGGLHVGASPSKRSERDKVVQAQEQDP